MKKKIISFLTAFCLMFAVFDFPADVSAAATHNNKHSVCAGTTCTDPNHSSHGEIRWFITSDLDVTSGNYYLTQDITLSKSVTLTGDLTICLNGHSITVPEGVTGRKFFLVPKGKTLTICDCSNKDPDISGSKMTNENGAFEINGGTFNMYGGNITKNPGTYGPVCLLKNGCFNMYGGKISNNIVTKEGGGVYGNGQDSIINMYGGAICDNSAGENGCGGGIYSRGTINIYGGTISGNDTPGNIGSGIYMYGGSLNLEGGEIIDNKGNSGVAVDGSCTFTMSGGKISGNKASSYNGGVRLGENSKFIMSGGKITDNESCGVIFNKNSTLTLNGLVNISNNTKSDPNDPDLWFQSGNGKIVIGENFQTNSPIVIETDVDWCYNPHTFAENVTADIKDRFTPAQKTHYISYEDETDTLTEHYPHKFSTDYEYDGTHHWHRCESYSRCRGESEHEEHTFVTEVTTAATCTSTGTQKLTCKCGYSKTEPIPAKGHTMTNTAAKAASCTKEGNIEYWYCSICQKYFKDNKGTTEITIAQTVIAKTGHTEKTVPAVAATCTATGLTEGKKCSVCDAVIKAQTVTAKIAHTYDAAYSHNANQHWQVCKVCGTAGPKSGHSWDGGTEITAATEYAEGETRYTCTVCGETKTEVIPKLAHTHKWETEWSTDENYHWHVCTECGMHDGDTAHDWGAGTVTEQPTCTTAGTRAFACSDCGAEKTETEPMAAHTEEIIPAVAPSCTESGLTEGKKCSVCDTVITAQATIDALGHDRNAGTVTTAPNCTDTGVKTFKCNRCGAETTEDIPAVGHTEVIDSAVAASCTATGLTEGKHCSVCNDVLVEQTVTAALGHDWDAGTVTTAPNCTDTGVKALKCSRCGVETTETIPAVGHTEVVDSAVAATCTATGLTEGKHCSVCNDVLVEQTVTDALGHSWNDGVVVTQPTESTLGTKKFTCTACGAEKTEQIPMGKITTESSTGDGAPATSIDTPSEELIKAALEEGEQDLIKDGTDIKIILTVEDATNSVPADDKTKVETQISGLSDCKLGQYLDVKLLKIIGNSETPITQTNKKITVTFEIPAKLRGKTEYSVIRVHNGVTTVLKDLDSERDTITINTDQFSTYALVYVEKTAGSTGSGGGSGRPSRPTGGGSYHRPSTDDDPETSSSDSSESGSSSESSIASSDSDSSSETSDSAPSDSNSSSETSISTPSDSGARSETSGSAPSDSGARSETSGSVPFDEKNPATGFAVSVIPLAATVVGLTAAVKRKRK